MTTARAPLRVVHVCTDFFPAIGGIEKFVLDLCRHSRRIGIETRVLCLNRIHGSSERLPGRDEVEGIPIRRVGFMNLKYYKPTVLPMRELRRADIVHVHGIGAPLDYAAMTRWLHRRPIVLSTHGGIFHTANLSLVKRVYFSTVHRLSQRLVDRTVASSRQDLELFRGVAKNLTLIENGTDLARFRSCDIAAKDPRRFVYVGRLSRNKRVDRVIDTFARLAAQDRELRLHIVGHDWENLLAGLQEQVRRLGIEANVVFAGGVTDETLAGELCAAAHFVSASEYEGFGISAIEAMAAGCVPIVNDIVAFRNIVSDGVDGILVDYANPEAAAQRTTSLLRASSREMAQRARMRAEDFAWERKVLEWEALYQGIRRRPTAADRMGVITAAERPS